MGRMCFRAGKPTGRATCRICGRKIADGVQVTASGWLARGSVHLGCLLDDYLLEIQLECMVAEQTGDATCQRAVVQGEVKA